ncbi:hypothetical protein BT96DRAFT_951153 [Gymnopus androsaceus JB14]|uniref:Uncharacterized protein n=1 Tax=Gymnopus androsaceus JB14 TaxID=1447944 RepID=A0A6A4GDQ6_9AGAR|nr:hypothetical protein BT96DRAFT_951153 [Gymnopus androsaceus JB14]
MVSFSSLCSSTHNCDIRGRNICQDRIPSSHQTLSDQSLRDHLSIVQVENNQLRAQLSSQQAELNKACAALAASPDAILLRVRKLEQQNMGFVTVYNASLDEINTFQGKIVTGRNKLEGLRHKAQELVIAQGAIAEFKNSFANMENQVQELEGLFEEHNKEIADLRCSNESLVEDLVQVVQVTLNLCKSNKKAHQEVGILATSAYLVQHTDLHCSLKVVMYNVVEPHACLCMNLDKSFGLAFI